MTVLLIELGGTLDAAGTLVNLQDYQELGNQLLALGIEKVLVQMDVEVFGAIDYLE